MVWRRGKQALTKSNPQQPPARNRTTVPEASSAAGSEVGVRSVGGNTATFRVSIPPGVVPGQEFQVRVSLLLIYLMVLSFLAKFEFYVVFFQG